MVRGGQFYAGAEFSENSSQKRLEIVVLYIFFH